MSFLQKKLVQAVLYVNSQWPIGKATISYNALQWVSSVLANFGALMTCAWSYYGELKMSLEPTLGLFKALDTIEGCATKSNADNMVMMTRVKPSASESDQWIMIFNFTMIIKTMIMIITIMILTIRIITITVSMLFNHCIQPAPAHMHIFITNDSSLSLRSTLGEKKHPKIEDQEKYSVDCQKGCSKLG